MHHLNQLYCTTTVNLLDDEKERKKTHHFKWILLKQDSSLVINWQFILQNVKVFTGNDIKSDDRAWNLNKNSPNLTKVYTFSCDLRGFTKI